MGNMHCGGCNTHFGAVFYNIRREKSIVALKDFVVLTVLTGYVYKCPIIGFWNK